MSELLKCGHSTGFLYRIRDADNVIKRFCIGCMVEACGITDLDGLVPAKKKEDYDRRTEQASRMSNEKSTIPKKEMKKKDVVEE